MIRALTFVLFLEALTMTVWTLAVAVGVVWVYHHWFHAKKKL